MTKLKIALIDDDIDRAEIIKCQLQQHGYSVVACLVIADLDLAPLQQLQADIILLDMQHPQRDIIESCVHQFDLPTVLFTKNSHKDTIKSAIDAGVTAYIVDGIDPSKLDSILAISIQQYKKHQALLQDLLETKNKLADRKDIEKAKVLLMQLHHFTEQEAYASLRKNAMSHRITLGDMARRFLDAQQLLHPTSKD